MIIVNGKEIQCVVHNGIVCPMYLNGKLITPSEEPETSVTIGGRVYPIVKIGNQIWMCENLDYKFEGLTINGESTWTGEKVAWYYDNNETMYGEIGNKYGLLYNYYAIKFLNDNKNTLLPDGWSVPTYNDFETLLATIEYDSSKADDESEQNKIKALKSTTGWYNNRNGTNELGLNIVPGGKRSGNNFFSELTESSYFGTLTQQNEYNNYQFKITSVNYVDKSTEQLTNGTSVRLVKNI